VFQDFFNHIQTINHRNDAHLRKTPGTQKWINFVNVLIGNPVQISIGIILLNRLRKPTTASFLSGSSCKSGQKKYQKNAVRSGMFQNKRF